MVFNYIQSNFIKIKRSSFLIVHILAAFLFPIVLYLYWGQRGALNNDTAIIYSYFQIIGATIPLMFAIVSVDLKNMEANVGKYKNLLGYSSSHYKPFFYQLLFTWLMYVVTLSLSGMIFIFLTVHFLGVSYCFKAVLLTFITYLVIGFVLCLLHQILSYVFGMGTVIGLGMAGLVVAALCETSLGDSIWYFIPWAWPLRLSDIIFKHLAFSTLNMVALIAILILIWLAHKHIFSSWDIDNISDE